MRLTRHIAALALACATAAAGPAPGDALPGASQPPAPGRMPEINVRVVPPRVTVDVDTPALHVAPGGEWSVHTDGLPELKRRLDRGEWRGALDLIQGPLRARLSRDPIGGLHVFAQSAPGPTPAPPPEQPPQPGQPPQPNHPGADNSDMQKRMLDLYHAQLGGRLQMQKGAFLGVSTSPVPDSLRQHLGLAEGVGLVVEVVEKDSPAEKAGLRQYDILNKLDDQILVNAQQLAVLIRARKPGETVKLTITRGGKEQTVPATLVEKDVKPLGEVGFWEGGGAPADIRIERRSADEAMKDWGDAQAQFKEFNFSNRNNRDDRNRNADLQKLRLKGRDKTTMVFTDDEYQLILTSPSGDPGDRHLTAVEKKTGKVVYNGGVGGDARDQLPPQIADRLKQLDQAGKTNGKGVPSEDAKPGQQPGEKRFDIHVDRPGRQSKIEKDKIKDKDGNKNEDRDRDGDNDNENDNDNDDSNAAAENRGANAALTIRGNDVLEVSISDLQAPGVETVKRARVRDGALSLPYIGPVKVEGLTEQQLKRRIVKSYAEAKLVANANVQVKRLPAGEVEVNVVEP